MNRTQIRLLVILIIAVSCKTTGRAQEVIIEYDKGTDCSKLHTYTWAEPENLATPRLLGDYIASTIEGQLEAKGFTQADEDSDLALVPFVTIDFVSNLAFGTRVAPIYGGHSPTLSSADWRGNYSCSASRGAARTQGRIILKVVNRRTNKVIWNGSATQILLAPQNEESVYLLGKAMTTLLEKFPPVD